MSEKKDPAKEFEGERIAKAIARAGICSRRDAETARLNHDAWQLAGSWTLTGEQASYGSLDPAHPFNPAGGAWGAFSVGLRYGALLIDPSS